MFFNFRYLLKTNYAHLHISEISLYLPRIFSVYRTNFGGNVSKEIKNLFVNGLLKQLLERQGRKIVGGGGGMGFVAPTISD